MTTADRMAVMDQGIVQQVGSPSNLFDFPCNRFVANFVGTMNVLEGLVKERTPSTITLSVQGIGDMIVPIIHDDTPAAPRLAASFRPHTVQLESGNAGKNGDARFLWIPGVVERSEFLGDSTRYGVKVGEQHIVADQSHYSGLPQFLPGAPVSVGVEPTQIRLLPA